MAVDPETVVLMSTYRVGFAQPKPNVLAAGELYIEVGDGTAPPKLWAGTIANGVALLAEATEVLMPPTEAPTNVDVPYLSQDGDTLHCTMGNWTGEPDSYLYQWQMDGADVGTASSADAYTLSFPEDTDAVATCVVTASNAVGVTTAPASNSVTITEP